MKCLAFILTLACAGCEAGSEAESENSAAAETYTVRAEVKSVDSDSRTLALHHEAIPSFKDREGETVGMGAMVMNFQAAPEVNLDSVKAGDPIRVTFEMRWQAGSELRATLIEKLPGDTELALEESHQQSGEDRQHEN